MRGYETIFIFRPSLNEEERMKLVEKIEKTISANGVLHESNYWGRKRFAYPIQKFGDGHFYLFVFDAESTVPYELKRLTKVTETILRSLVIVRKTTYQSKEPPIQETPSSPTVHAKEPELEGPKESVLEEAIVQEVLNEDANAE